LKQHAATAETPEQWELLRRTVAFLKSGLDLPDTGTPRSRGAAWWKLPVGVMSLALIVVAAYLAVTRSPWWLLLPGAVIGWPWLLVQIIGERRPAADDDATRWAPFASEAQWRAHEPLLEAERIPHYDRAVHGVPIRGRAARFFFTIYTVAFAAPVILPLLALLFLLPRYWRWR
jgi:hypothetical protein